MAAGGVPTVLDAQGRCLGGRGHNSESEGFSQQAITKVAVARMFLPVHAHVCGPRWLIYLILSYCKCNFKKCHPT